MRVVQNDTHNFFSKALSSQYGQNDIKKTMGRFKKNIGLTIDDLYKLVTKKLGVLEDGIIPKLTDFEASSIKNYLYCIDVFKDFIEYYINRDECSQRKESILTQPGLRYAQILAVLDSIQETDLTGDISIYDVKEQIYADCVGNLFEECIRYNTIYEYESIDNALSNTSTKNTSIYKIKYSDEDGNAEFDMLVHHNDTNSTDIYEIKHGQKEKSDWFANFRNAKFLQRIEEEFGQIQKMSILYNGPTRTCSLQDSVNIQLVHTDDFFSTFLQNYHQTQL